MAKDKSILEKFTDTVKGIASTATEAASQALKADEPGLRADDSGLFIGLQFPTWRPSPRPSPRGGGGKPKRHMTVLESQLNPRSAEFQANAASNGHEMYNGVGRPANGMQGTDGVLKGVERQNLRRPEALLDQLHDLAS